MADIVETLPDGRKLVFPAGTDPKVVAATRRRIEAESSQSSGGVASGAAAPASAAGAPEGARPGALADSFLARTLRGALINRVDPAAEMMARGARAVGLPADVESVQRANVERRQLQADSRARAGDEGMDLAATTGTLATDLLAGRGMLNRMGRPDLATPRNIPDLAKSGALLGTAAGVASPVEGSEGMSDAVLAGQKALQTGVSGVIGGVASPLMGIAANKVIDGLGSAAGAVKNTLQRTFSPSEGQRLVRDPAKLEEYLAVQARSAGIDWAAVPEAMRESFRTATQRATQTTGELPEQAIRNRMVAEAARLPQLTLGQSTRNPSQFSREMNSPDEGMRDYLANQQTAATERLRQLQGAQGTPRSPYEAGTVVSDDVAKQAKDRRTQIGELYDTFRSEAAGYHRIKNTPDFVKSAAAELKVNQLYDDLPPVFRKQLEELEASGGRLSIRDAAQLWKNVNSYLGATRGTPAGAALGTLKTELGKLMDNAEFTATDKGGEVIELFRRANAERRAMGQWEDSSRAIKDLASRDPKVATERIIDRYVLGGSVDDFTGLWKTLSAPSRQQVKAKFVDHVVGLAFNQYGTQAVSPGRAVQYLRNYPKEKLAQLFPGEELKQLRNTLEYLRLTKEAPPGNFVNRSGTAVDLKDLLSSSRNLPVAGPMISEPLRKLSQQAEAARATSGALTVPEEAGESALSRNLVPVAPYAPASLFGGALSTTEEDEAR